MLMARIRRMRSLAALLVLFSPPLAGTAVPYFDPCPVDMPWLAETTTSGSHSGHGAGQDPASSGEHQGACHCLGECAGGTGPAALAAAAFVPAAETVPADPRPSRRAASFIPAAPVRYLTPPSTAPPVSFVA